MNPVIAQDVGNILDVALTAQVAAETSIAVCYKHGVDPAPWIKERNKAKRVARLARRWLVRESS